MSAVSDSILRHTEEQINPELLLGDGRGVKMGEGKETGCGLGIRNLGFVVTVLISNTLPPHSQLVKLFK